MTRADEVRLTITADRTTGLSAHEQVRLQVLAHLATGRLAAGDLVPEAAELAARSGLPTETVRRAYDELERAGVLTVDADALHVAQVPTTLPTGELRTAAVRLVTWARDAGLDDDAILDLVRRALLGLPAPVPDEPSVPSPRTPFEVPERRAGADD
ncbi:GntR family transcriptional regulator [Actinotalea sp. M2MS4P-6]|uniref:GntR family transcriptional regulator n=1 Tax=Actinotalea sp. M2MS4P-6 TaxID=2983762 RepID=UPI0021E3E9B6|nr:GntR family transcriptional regulator [Actinotalea sp. M2MS4P-6]MCV2395597.1 GntR family transcriptional regulator [Actinotalea sp. M2MS4P-6]